MTTSNNLLWILIGVQILLLVGLSYERLAGADVARRTASDPANREGIRRVERRLDEIEGRLSRLEISDPERYSIPESDRERDPIGLTELTRRVLNFDRSEGLREEPGAGDRSSVLRARMSEAIRRGDSAELLRLVGEARNPDLVNGDGQTPLVEAAKAGKLEIVRSLIRAGAVLDRRGDKGRTPLIESLSSDQPAVAIELIDCGSDISLVDETGETAMVWAAWRGHLAAVRRLIDGGANPNQKANGNPPIVDAIRGGHLWVVRYLVAKGVDVQLTDAQGATPLANALSGGKDEIVAYLRRIGAR